MRLLVVMGWICALLMCSANTATAADPSGGAVAPADATVETNTGGSLAPAPPDPSPALASEPRMAPVHASIPAQATPAAPATAPRVVAAAAALPPNAHRAVKAVEPPAGGGEGSSPPKPLPPSSGTAAAKPREGGSGPSLAISGGELATTLTLGILFLATGLAGAAFARRRRAAY